MKDVLPLLIILPLFIIVMTIISKKQQKSLQNAENLVNALKIGDKVKTHLGIYGVIVDFYDTTDGKIAKINISQTETPCIIDLNSRYLAGEDKKQVVEFDENGNVIRLDGVDVETIQNEESILSTTLENETKNEEEVNTDL